jgi:HmuY protein
MQLLWVTPTEYRIRFSMYNNTLVTEFTIPKNQDYSLMYFSFENGGQMVDAAPKKNNWDMVFTKYTHIYLSEPVTSPYRYYIVCGALLNKWSDNENAIAKKDSTPNYKPFNEITSADIGTFNFTKNAAQIGFEFKNYDFNLGYTIFPDQYYMLRDPSGYYYKIRFLDFYDSQGNKGAASFEYQRL